MDRGRQAAAYTRNKKPSIFWAARASVTVPQQKGANRWERPSEYACPYLQSASQILRLDL